MVEMEQEPKIYRTHQENFKQKLCKYGKSWFLIVRQHFSMVLLWGQLHRDFLRFDNWTRPSGRLGDFYQVAQGQHPLLCALSTAESLSCPKSIGSIGGTPIFWGQQYSSCSKAGGAMWVPGCIAAGSEDSLGICWVSVGWHRHGAYPLLVLRPDLDSSQDSRKVSPCLDSRG